MMCLKFATMEKSLGEIDRAREIYKHTSQFCDPRKEAEFWKVSHAQNTKPKHNTPTHSSLPPLVYCVHPVSAGVA